MRTWGARNLLRQSWISATGGMISWLNWELPTVQATCAVVIGLHCLSFMYTTQMPRKLFAVNFYNYDQVSHWTKLDQTWKRSRQRLGQGKQMMCEIYSLKNNLFVARHQRRAAIQSHHAHRNAHAATQPVSHNPSGIRQKKKRQWKSRGRQNH